MEPMNIGVLVVGVILIALSVFLVVRDQRKRERNKKLAARREKAARYSDLVDHAMEDVCTMLFTYMARTALTLPTRTGRHIDEHEAALLPIQYEYDYKGKYPYAQRTSNSAIFYFGELGMHIRRTATIMDVTMEVDVPGQNFNWIHMVGNNTTLLSAVNNFERLMQKREVPPDLSELLPRDAAWMCRLAHISTTNYKWLLVEADAKGSKVTQAELDLYKEHLRLLYIDLKNTLMTN